MGIRRKREYKRYEEAAILTYDHNPYPVARLRIPLIWRLRAISTAAEINATYDYLVAFKPIHSTKSYYPLQPLSLSLSLHFPHLLILKKRLISGKCVGKIVLSNMKLYLRHIQKCLDRSHISVISQLAKHMNISATQTLSNWNIVNSDEKNVGVRNIWCVKYYGGVRKTGKSYVLILDTASCTSWWKTIGKELI